MKKITNWVLGLTGGIGAGKTAVSNMLEQLNISVVDADIVAREVVLPKTAGLAAIVARFSSTILNADGTLNRSKLRAKVFAEPTEKQWLNNLLHPLIRERLLMQLNQASSPYVVLVAPLLFENDLAQYCQRTLLVDVPVEVQIARTIQRDKVTKQQAEQIIAAQMSRQDKLTKADDIINNNRPLAEVANDLQQLHQQYLALAAQ
ncbi:dephospho-CoA kinase [Pseudoalteromonas mariniglutinosa]|uniref:dephospho-CoA kinase n=1 Tax=Pseudoalteromonas mariniglutinosa TaxID=206042 RepID=UPI00384CCEC4